MKPSSPPPSEATAPPSFDAREIAERKAFLEFTQQDRDCLRHLHSLLKIALFDMGLAATSRPSAGYCGK